MNRLNGSIPDTISSTKHLSTIDLSRNNLIGSILEILSNLGSLRYLNLSFNMLEGHVLETGVFMNMNSSTLQGNSGLCGVKSVKKCEKNTKHSRSHRISKALVIILALGCVLVLVILLLAFYAIQKMMKKRNNRVKNSKIEFRSTVPLKRFEAKDIAIATNSFSPDNIIGSSSLSIVYKGVLEDGEKVAVKKLNLKQFAQESDKCFYREINTLGKLRHWNLVRVLGYAWENGSLRALVLEFMESGNLETIIHDSDKDNNPCWSLMKRIDALVLIATRLVYLHTGYDFPIVHCDLKSSNVLLDAEFVAHVSDFGTARILGVYLEDGSSVASSSAFEGTIGYLAPEFAYMRKIKTKIDVFSFGIMIMELITRNRPTELTSEDGLPITLSQLVDQAVKNGINGLGQVLDSHLKSNSSKQQEVLVRLLELALSCANMKPENRPDMEQVLCSLDKIRKMA